MTIVSCLLEGFGSLSEVGFAGEEPGVVEVGLDARADGCRRHFERESRDGLVQLKEINSRVCPIQWSGRGRCQCHAKRIFLPKGVLRMKILRVRQDIAVMAL